MLLTEPFQYLIKANQRVYWLYLLMAAVLAGWVFIHIPGPNITQNRTSRLKRFLKFLSFCFPKRIYGHRSARIDYIFFILNRIAFPWLIAPLIVGTVGTSQVTKEVFGLFPFDSGSLGKAHTTDQIIFTIILLIAMDAAIYIAHYLQHHVGALWEFHKIHHSAEVLTPITIYRVHPVDDLLTGSVVGVSMGFVIGLGEILYVGGVSSFVIAGLNVGLVIFYLCGYNLRHSHIQLSYHYAASHLFISPAQHQIHHSSDRLHFGKNLGFIFAIWDWAAGTLLIPKKHTFIKFGIADADPNDFDSVWKLYWNPIRNVGRMLIFLLKKYINQ